jgi:hypothetical protein
MKTDLSGALYRIHIQDTMANLTGHNKKTGDALTSPANNYPVVVVTASFGKEAGIAF